MPTNKERIKLLAQSWDRILRNVSDDLNISEVDYSALSSWIEDCYESFEEIYHDLLERIINAEPSDYGTIHDCVVDIFFALDHIKRHINDADNGFQELMKALANKSEEENQ